MEKTFPFTSGLLSPSTTFIKQTPIINVTVHQITYVIHWVNPKEAGLFANWYGQGRVDSATLCDFCLNGPIDLKFGM